MRQEVRPVLAVAVTGVDDDGLAADLHQVGVDGKHEVTTTLVEELRCQPRRRFTDLGLTRLGKELSRRKRRSEEHTSELQSLMRISYAVFCLKKKTTTIKGNTNNRSKDKQRKKPSVMTLYN